MRDNCFSCPDKCQNQVYLSFITHTSNIAFHVKQLKRLSITFTKNNIRLLVKESQKLSYFNLFQTFLHI